MNTYEQEIFDFFSTEDNFKNMYKVAGHFDKIRKTLLEHFWELVTNNLKDKVADANGKWMVRRMEQLEVNHSKLILYKNSWVMANGQPVIAVAFERLASENWPFYGIFVNNFATDFDLDGIRNYARNLPIAKDFDFDSNKWWAIFGESGIDFSNQDGFLKILPSVREETATELANLLYHFAISNENELDTMAGMKKK